MTHLTIRAATPADAETVHAAILALGRHLGTADHIESKPADLAAHGLAQGGAFEGLIAEADSSFAGMCLYLPVFSTWLGRPGVYVQDLWVEPGIRGLKVGERLMRRAAAIARERGATHLRLAVDTHNTGAQGFYERIGVTHHATDRIHSAYDDAFQALADADTEDDR